MDSDKPRRSVVRTADSLLQSILTDSWPSDAVCADYGIFGTNEHKIYDAYKKAFYTEKITTDLIHKSCGNGKKLSQLIGIKIKTAWDIKAA